MANHADKPLTFGICGIRMLTNRMLYNSKRITCPSASSRQWSDLTPGVTWFPPWWPWLLTFWPPKWVAWPTKIEQVLCRNEGSIRQIKKQDQNWEVPLQTSKNKLENLGEERITNQRTHPSTETSETCPTVPCGSAPMPIQLQLRTYHSKARGKRLA